MLTESMLSYDFFFFFNKWQIIPQMMVFLFYLLNISLHMAIFSRQQINLYLLSAKDGYVFVYMNSNLPKMAAFMFIKYSYLVKIAIHKVISSGVQMTFICYLLKIVILKSRGIIPWMDCDMKKMCKFICYLPKIALNI